MFDPKTSAKGGSTEETGRSVTDEEKTKKIPKKEFTTEKLLCRESVQLIRILALLKFVSPAHVEMVALYIASKVNPKHALVLDFNDNVADWGQAIILFELAKCKPNWIGVCHPDWANGVGCVIVAMSSLSNRKSGTMIPFAALKIKK